MGTRRMRVPPWMSSAANSPRPPRPRPISRSCSGPTSTSRWRSHSARPAPAVARFAEWLRQRDVEVGPLQLREIGRGRGGRGLFAAEDIQGGTRILRVPIAKAVLSLEHVFETPGLGDVARKLYVPDEDLWAVFLNHELRRDASPWADYLRVLPTTEELSLPLFYTQQELEQLKGSPNLHFARKRIEAVEKNYARTSTPIFVRHPELFAGPEEYSLDDHKWGMAMVWSRRMEIKVRNPHFEQPTSDGAFPHDKWLPAKVFVPMVDMINMGQPDEINVICRTHASGDYVDCVTDRDVPTGTEILRRYHEYDNLPNSRLFNDFGFAFENNVDEMLPVPMPRVPMVEHFERKQAIMAMFPPQVSQALDKETKERKEITVSWSRKLFEMPGLMAYMRALYMTAKDHTKLPEEIFDAFGNNKPLSVVSERGVVDSLVTLLREQLRQYPTTMEEDEAALDELHRDDALHDFNASTNERVMRTLVYAEKFMLHTHIRYLQEHYEAYAAAKGKRKAKKKSKGKSEQRAETNDDGGDDGEYRTNTAWRFGVTPEHKEL
eukprot:Unigene113_Nuclearia_a/m.370 Unigene113_Nuclearia_a/g.370  ORF Unigene113_Nuclearia_a/g.370 Unigene113_Nuclearia_a/m.370 type:complete len:549 (+) Unigene113_Nuclearia_a:1372-3018(+)